MVQIMFEKHKSKPVNPSPKPDEQVSVKAPAAAPTVSNNRRNAVIGSTVKIKGEVSGDEDLIIEGHVEGTITLLSHTLTVGKDGKVFANVRAKTVNIDGEVKGDITGGEKVVISKAGRVQGNIVAPRVTLEDGALFKGSIDMDPGAPTTAELPLNAAKPKADPSAGGSVTSLSAKNG